MPGLDDFTASAVRTDSAEIAIRIGGSGPPAILLHGYPQNQSMWHRVAPALAIDHTVVLMDLRGYGDSSRPPSDEDHASYSKRAMAADVVAVMDELGHDTVDVVGHDRGARVTHRLCLDHPQRVRRAAVLDIVPTRHAFATTDRELGIAYYHWFFLAQPPGLPERMIGSDPAYWVRHHLDAWARRRDAFDTEAVAEYVRTFDAESIRATCEDYRAGATIDLEHDEMSYAAGDRVACPLLVLWGADGFVGTRYDPLAVWRDYADDVIGEAFAGGHFLPEESPDGTAAALRRFLA